MTGVGGDSAVYACEAHRVVQSRGHGHEEARVPFLLLLALSCTSWPRRGTALGIGSRTVVSGPGGPVFLSRLRTWAPKDLKELILLSFEVIRRRIALVPC